MVDNAAFTTTTGTAAVPSPVIYEGYLTKQGGNFKTWRRRWFSVRSKQMLYFKEKGVGVCACARMYLATCLCGHGNLSLCVPRGPRQVLGHKSTPVSAHEPTNPLPTTVLNRSDATPLLYTRVGAQDPKPLGVITLAYPLDKEGVLTREVLLREAPLRTARTFLHASSYMCGTP